MPSGRRPAAAHGGGRRAPEPGGRASAALGARPRPGRPRGANRRGARGRGRSPSRARRRGARVSLAEGARRVNELALASFAAASDAHLVGEPRSARFAAFKARFDAGAELARLDALGLRFLARSDPGFPPLLRAIHDPPPGLFLRGAAGRRAARPARGRDRRRACLLGLRPAGRARPRPRPRRRGPRRRQRSRPRRRRRGPSRRARGFRADRRRARLRHRPRLSGRPSRAGESGRGNGAPRLGVRAGRRACTVALSRRATGSWPVSAPRPWSSRRASGAAP